VRLAGPPGDHMHRPTLCRWRTVKRDVSRLGFQAETRSNPLNGDFTDMVADLGTL